jgi:hypothetical protein
MKLTVTKLTVFKVDWLVEDLKHVKFLLLAPGPILLLPYTLSCRGSQGKLHAGFFERALKVNTSDRHPIVVQEIVHPVEIEARIIVWVILVASILLVGER